MNAALSPAAYSMFSDMFSKDKLGKAVGIYSIGSFIGGGMAFLVGGYVISLLKDATFIDVPLLGIMKAWQVAFILVGLPGVFIGLLFILTVRDPQRTGQKLDASGNVVKVKFTDSFKFLKKHSKTFTCHYMGFTFYAMALFCVMSWSPAFYMRNFGLSPVETGYMLGTILLIANTSGVFFAGWLTDYLTSKGRRDAAMYAGYLGGLGIILPIISYTLVDSLWLSVAIFTVAMFFASFPMPTSTAAMQILAPNQLRGGSGNLNNTYK